jgi:hypothetical protein
VRLPTASEHPRVIECPASAALPQVHVETPQANLGTAVHAFMRRAKEVGRDEALAEVPDDAEHRAFCEQIPVEDFPQGGSPELSLAWNHRTDKARFLGTDRNYSTVSEDEYCGTADLAGSIDGVALIEDYKTGRVYEAAKDSAQIKTLSLLQARAIGASDAIGRLRYLRDDGSYHVDEAEFSPFDLAEHAETLRKLPKEIARARLQVSMGEVPDVSNGPWCRYCPAAPACPAKTALARNMGADIIGIHGRLTQLTPTEGGEVYARALVYRDMLSEVIENLRDLARIRPLPLPDGSELREVSEKAPTRIVGDVAEKVLRELYGDEIAKNAIEVERRTSFAAIKDSLRAVAKPGALAKLERETREALRNAGGLKESMIPKVKAIKGESR